MKFAKIRVIFFVDVFFSFLSVSPGEEMAIPNMMTIVYIYLCMIPDVPFVGLSPEIQNTKIFWPFLSTYPPHFGTPN